MSGFDRFFSGEPLILEGHVVKCEDGRYAIQVSPGLVVDVDKDHLEDLEEATDPVSGRRFVRVTLKPDSQITAVFEPQLARLALTSKTPDGIPFSCGGQLPDTDGGAVYAQAPIQGSLGPAGALNVGTIGEFPTRSRSLFWGWINDDKNLTD
jgi:hypothetical protein